MSSDMVPVFYERSRVKVGAVNIYAQIYLQAPAE